MHFPLSMLVALLLVLHTSSAHADLIPPGGEGVGECRDKKAGEACERAFFEAAGIRFEKGTCVEEKLDHLHFKFRAHLRCVAAAPPAASASASASTNAAPSAIASAVPAVSAPAPVALPPPEPPVSKGSGGCSIAGTSTGAGLIVFAALVMAGWSRRIVYARAGKGTKPAK